MVLDQQTLYLHYHKYFQLLQQDAQTIKNCCSHFLACVVGKHNWKQQTKIELISQVATISDEAFALLVLENIWDEWKVMNMVGFSSRHEGMEKETKRKKIGIWHWKGMWKILWMEC